MVQIKITQLECKCCGKKWTPRSSTVRQCPACKSTYWDTGSPRAKQYKRAA